MTGKQIKAIRAVTGLTQAGLACRVGVTKNTVARWERGEMKPGGPAVVLLTQLAKETKGKP